MQIPRFTSSKPSKFAFASDEKSIRQSTTSFVRCYHNEENHGTGENANEKAAVHIRPCKAYADIVLSGSADRIKYKNFLNRIIAVIQEVYFAE